MRRLLIASLLCLALGPAWAEDAPGPKTPSMADATSIVQRNMLVRLQGSEAGGAAMRLGRMADGSVLMETDFLMRMKRRNGPDVEVFESKSHTLEFYDAQRRLRWKRERKTDGPAVKTIVTRYGDTHADVAFESPGAKFEKRIELPENHATDFQVFLALLPLFREGKQAHRAYVTLDEEEKVFKRKEMTILGTKTVEHGGESHVGYLVKAVAPMGTAMIVADDEYVPMHMTMMGVIEAVWVDGSPFEFAAGGWEMSSFVPVEGVAPMSAHLESLEVTVTLGTKVESDKPVFRDTRYQTVKRDGDAYRLTLRSTRPPDETMRKALPIAVEDETIKRFLASTPLSQSDHPSIVAQAKKIVTGTKDAGEAVRAIVRWVYRALEKRGGASGNASAVEVLESGVGDCTEHAALTVALCRAVGIPARNLGGLEYLVLRDNKPAAGYHAWAEVWLGQWIGVDATIPEIGTAARYVLLQVNEPGEEEHETFVQVMLGKLRLRIDAYQHVGGERTIVAR